MRTGAHLEIEFEVIGTTNLMSLRTEVEAEALSFAKQYSQPNSELFVACLGNGVDYGNLIIEVDMTGNFTVRVHEHRGFIVEGIAREQALGALEYWLQSQERTPNLEWQDA